MPKRNEDEVLATGEEEKGRWWWDDSDNNNNDILTLDYFNIGIGNDTKVNNKRIWWGNAAWH